MRIFFDTEFTGLHKDTTLISIGMISEDGKIFYAEFTDYNKKQVDEWIYNNVISNLFITDKILYDLEKTMIKGDKLYIKNRLKKWLSQFEEIQFISDVSHYDFILLIDIFENAFDLPKNVSPYCIDINQLIAEKNDITCKEAFDLCREDIIECDIYKQKHNSLYDAIVIKEIYRTLNFDIK